MTKYFLIITALVLSTNSYATLIDNNSYTTDDATGLDWLDLNFTVNMSYADALTNNPGWRYATNNEIVNLFQTAFTGYIANGTVSDDISAGYSGDVYSTQVADVYRFESLFGPGYTYEDSIILDGYAPYQTHELGLYQNNNGDLMTMGAHIQDFSIYGVRQFSELAWTEVYGVNSTNTYYNKYRTVDSANWLSTYLIRDESYKDTYVPIPSSIWLFLSGLAFLIKIKGKN